MTITRSLRRAGRFRPPLFVLLAQACLGLVALGVPDRPPGWPRVLPLAGAAAALPVAAIAARDSGGELAAYYGWPAGQVLPVAGLALLLATVLVGVGLAARNDLRGGWALLVLLGPIGMLWLYPLAAYGDGPGPDWTTLATAAIIVAVAATIVVSAALTVRRRIVLTHSTKH